MSNWNIEFSPKNQLCHHGGLLWILRQAQLSELSWDLGRDMGLKMEGFTGSRCLTQLEVRFFLPLTYPLCYQDGDPAASAYSKRKRRHGLLKKLDKLRKLGSGLAAGGLDEVCITQARGRCAGRSLRCPSPSYAQGRMPTLPGMNSNSGLFSGEYFHLCCSRRNNGLVFLSQIW